ncbi:hypothetical protein GGX14DRAFT_328504, partial [Mycena pura]
GRAISGIGLGAISDVAPAFASECAPRAVRTRIAALFHIAVTAGVLMSYAITCAS